MTSKSPSLLVQCTPLPMALQICSLARWPMSTLASGYGWVAASYGQHAHSWSHCVRLSLSSSSPESSLPSLWDLTFLCLLVSWVTLQCRKKEALRNLSMLQVSIWVLAWVLSQSSSTIALGKYNSYHYFCLLHTLCCWSLTNALKFLLL